MKYFTPDLLARYGSADDRIADAADVEWEIATEAYQKHFRSIERELPKKFRSLLRRYQFHDATVSFVGMNDQVLHLTVQLDAPPRETIFLRYLLVDEFKMVSDADSSPQPKLPLLWLYDEIDIVSNGAYPTIEQRIVFSDGLELSIPFQDMTYSTAHSLPLIAKGAGGAVRVEFAG